MLRKGHSKKCYFIPFESKFTNCHFLKVGDRCICRSLLQRLIKNASSGSHQTGDHLFSNFKLYYLPNCMPTHKNNSLKKQPFKKFKRKPSYKTTNGEKNTLNFFIN